MKVRVRKSNIKRARMVGFLARKKTKGGRRKRSQASKMHSDNVIAAWLQHLPLDAREYAEFILLTGLRRTELERLRLDWVEQAPPGIVTAAILAARAKGRITIVGERAGDDLQFWAEGGFLTLPNSGLRVHYCDGYHDWRHGYDADDERNRANPRIAAVDARYSAAAGNLDPDPVIPLTFRDYAAGRVPVMEQIRPVLDAPAR